MIESPELLFHIETRLMGYRMGFSRSVCVAIREKGNLRCRTRLASLDSRYGVPPEDTEHTVKTIERGRESLSFWLGSAGTAG